MRMLLILISFIPVQILKIIDGDTYKVLYHNKQVSVRLIGIDTPESHLNKKAYRDARRSHKDVQEIFRMGKAVTEFVKTLVKPGQEVFLEFDVQKYDRYGRLLAYVWLDSTRLLNEILVKEGYALVYTFPPNVKYQERFLKAQKYARQHGKGLWGQSIEARAPPNEGYYVGNKRSKVFHLLSCVYAKRISSKIEYSFVMLYRSESILVNCSHYNLSLS